jgi:hypothetical protein
VRPGVRQRERERARRLAGTGGDLQAERTPSCSGPAAGEAGLGVETTLRPNSPWRDRSDTSACSAPAAEWVLSAPVPMMAHHWLKFRATQPLMVAEPTWGLAGRHVLGQAVDGSML